MLDEFPPPPPWARWATRSGLQIQAQYTSGGDKVHMCYSFEFLSGITPTPERVGEVLTRYEEAIGDGWACWAFSNHDVARHASRWCLPVPAQRTYAALLMSLRGSVCLYQGEELGLTEAYVPYEKLQDPYGIRFWPKFKGRDGCRTPMPWVTDNGNGGFSDGKPWLPVAMEHLANSVATQEGDAGSTLAFYRRMLAFRATEPALAKGDFALVRAEDGIVAFTRTHAGRTILCAFNLTDTDGRFDMPEGSWTPLPAPFEAAGPTLGPWQALFAAQEATDG